MAVKEVAKKELLCAAISSNVPEVLSLQSFGDTSSSDSDMLEPDSTKIAGGEKADKKERALVIIAKATVGENPKQCVTNQRKIGHHQVLQ
jgi:hypothetical protein